MVGDKLIWWVMNIDLRPNALECTEALGALQMSVSMLTGCKCLNGVEAAVAEWQSGLSWRSKSSCPSHTTQGRSGPVPSSVNQCRLSVGLRALQTPLRPLIARVSHVLRVLDDPMQ